MTPDYAAALSGAALFDRSAAGKLVLTGDDAPMFLGNLSTNDTKNLPLGGGCEAYFCDPRAKVQFAAWIYHVRLADGQHAMWVETTPGRGAELLKYLDRYLISERVELADRTADFAQFHLAGPGARAVLEKALADRIPDLPEFAHMERTFGSHVTASVRRRDRSGCRGTTSCASPTRPPACGPSSKPRGPCRGRQRRMRYCGSRPARRCSARTSTPTGS